MPGNAPAEHRTASIIDTVDLKDGLREIEANGNDDGHGGILRLMETAPLFQAREGVVHAIKWQLQHRYLSLETITGSSDGAAIDLPAALTEAA
jgi:hypothetical protein